MVENSGVISTSYSMYIKRRIIKYFRIQQMEEGSATADSILATYAFLMKLNNSTAHGKNSLDFVNRHAVVIFRWTITPLACNHQHWQGVILFADIGNVLFSVGHDPDGPFPNF
ncbi:hypothetical protein Y032_0032g2567 [Ancylostoma ceylanicum]|uniref:Uncharacterized protein n=2 Tax=Ancylostoma ceylanicum TaxID=53326 RepID=A0A016UNE8_9BILA|nr:hypothetical protein Y032_0032g2567 [Ancylostoma ceylanicum]